MNFEDYYTTIEKIKFLDYEIDDSFNLSLFNELQSILHLSLKHRLGLSVTGTIACLFHTNKMFRTISDIDLIAEYKDIKTWIKIISKDYNLEYLIDPIKYIKYQIGREGGISFKNINNNLKIDFIFNKKLEDKFYLKKISSFEINYRLPYKYKRIQNNIHFYNRKKDLDDIRFYDKYFEYPRDFIIS
jgi:hypothetical protein